MTAEETMARIRQAAEEIGELKRLVKERSMVYQVEKKETMARHWEVPLNSFYDLAWYDFEILNWQYEEETTLDRLRDTTPFEYGTPYRVVTREIAPRTFSVKFEPESEPVLGTIRLAPDGVWVGVNNQGEAERFIWYIYALSFVVSGTNDRNPGEVEKWLEGRARIRREAENA